jgi:hypothetical protein
MTFEIDIGFTSLTGRRDINEDVCAAMLPEHADGAGAVRSLQSAADVLAAVFAKIGIKNSFSSIRTGAGSYCFGSESVFGYVQLDRRKIIRGCPPTFFRNCHVA